MTPPTPDPHESVRASFIAGLNALIASSESSRNAWAESLTLAREMTGYTQTADHMMVILNALYEETVQLREEALAELRRHEETITEGDWRDIASKLGLNPN